MKQAKRPTAAQKAVISAHGLVVKNWLVIADTAETLCVIHRNTDTVRYLKKPEKSVLRGKR